jgi:hypothetical protein
MNFQTHQATFAAYIRNPANTLPKGVKPQRMEMYRELFFNNIEGFLSSNFPVLRTLFNEKNWQEFVQDFFENHVCVTPHFSQIPEEFLAYLQNERKNSNDLPFLVELVHYEWVEMALSISHDVFEKSTVENLMTAKLKLSPLAVALAYQFPVHKICAEFMPKESEQPTFLLVYRNENDAVQFLDITPLTFQLLQFVENFPEQPTDFYFAKLTEIAPMISADILRKNGIEILEDFVKRSVILGA